MPGDATTVGALGGELAAPTGVGTASDARDAGLHLVVPGGDEALVRARAAVSEWLGQGVSDDLAADIRLIVTELVTNGLRAAATLVELRAERRSDRVEVRVYDDAAGWPRPLTPGARDSHGRGLQIVAALSLRWGVTAEAEGKTVWAQVAATP